MPYHPSLRSVPGFGLRLGLGLGLLLGSGGLAWAITLVLPLVTPGSRAVPTQWQVATKTRLSDTELSRVTLENADFHAVYASVPTHQLRYSFADSFLLPGSAGLLRGPVPNRFAPVGPGPSQPHPTLITDTVSLVQRSWLTIKTMFR
ncbi:MAG: hypothetical protein ACRYG7_30745 [Janthinobacterium lividum]